PVRVNLHLDLGLRVAVALDRFPLLDRGLLHHRWPGPQALVPGFLYLVSTACPLCGRPDEGIVGKLERRTVGTELAGEFLRRLRVGLQFLPQCFPRGRLLRVGGRRQGGQEQSKAETLSEMREMAQHRCPPGTSAGTVRWAFRSPG